MFRLESTNLYPREGVIKYRLGIGVRKDKKAGSMVISLYGVWKFGLDLNFYFSIGNIIFILSYAVKKLDAELFLRMSRSAKEQGVEAGVRIPF